MNRGRKGAGRGSSGLLAPGSGPVCLCNAAVTWRWLSAGVAGGGEREGGVMFPKGGPVCYRREVEI